jgi:hypothetical protein
MTKAQPNWSMVADNLFACIEAAEDGRPFSFAIQHPGPYANLWLDLAEAYFDKRDFYYPYDLYEDDPDDSDDKDEDDYYYYNGDDD